MELSHTTINHIVRTLNEADGEDVHNILKQSNWTEQIFKQLIMTEDLNTVEYWYQQRKEMESIKKEKLSAIKLTGQTEYTTIIFNFEDDENEYTVTYNENGDEVWVPIWDVRCDGEEVEENELREKLINLAYKSLRN
jgi:hypothetical protein